MIDKDYIKRNCISTLKFEGGKPSKEAIEINEKFLNKEITSEQAIKKIKKWWGFT